jgi:hypothetical protein
MADRPGKGHDGEVRKGDPGMLGDGTRPGLRLGSMLLIGLFCAASWLAVGLLIAAAVIHGWLNVALIAAALVSGIAIGVWPGWLAGRIRPTGKVPLAVELESSGG